VDLSGTVVDAAGLPVSGARISLGASRGGRGSRSVATTDADGKFTLRRLRPGAAIVTASHAGLAPGVARVRLGAANEPVRLSMAPGRTITGKVVDKSGKPMDGVRVSINQWHGISLFGLWIVTTDSSGVYTLADAPTDQFQLEAYKDGYMGDVEDANPGETTRDFTISPELIVTGSVVDATTHRPIDEFTIKTGARWSFDDTPTFPSVGQKFTRGHYNQALSGSHDQYIVGLYLRVEAAGYLPADSLQLKASGTQDFELQPAKDLVGRVLMPNGNPAAGAGICLVLPGQNFNISNGSLQRQQYSTFTDGLGRFDLPPQSGKYLVVAVGDGGFVQADQDALAKSTDLTMSAWGSIEGSALVGGKPAADQQIEARLADQVFDSKAPVVQFDSSAYTDQQGHFKLDRVVPGEVSIGRIVEQPGGHGNFSMETTETATVEAGKAATITLGAGARAVTGSIQLPVESSGWGDYEVTVSIVTNGKMLPDPMPAQIQNRSPEDQQKWWNDFYKTDAGSAYREALRKIRNYHQDIGSDGKFTFDSVAPGDYRLWVGAYPRRGGNFLAVGQTEFSAPQLAPGAIEAPVEIPPIKATAINPLLIGDAAPDLQTLNGEEKQLNLSDFSGKYVLLEFVGPADAGDQSDVQAIKDVYATFQKNPRLVIFQVMVGDGALAPDRLPAAGPTDASWQQGRIIQTLAWRQRWSISGIPDVFLVAPDGKVIGRDLRGEAIASAVRGALKPVP
jgi:protocatechuate 3,4-dioxygenase beta subunit